MLDEKGAMLNHVAIVLPGALPVPCVLGGAIESTIQLIVEQNEIHKRLKITVFTPYEKTAKELSCAFKQTQFIWIYKGRLYRLINFFIRGLRKVFFKRMDHLDGQILKWHLRKATFDKVIIHSNIFHLLALAKVLPKEKLVFYIHANLFFERTRFNERIGRAAGRYVAISEFVKREVVKNSGVAPPRVSVLKNPIDFEKFNAVSNSERCGYLAKKYDIKPDDFVLLFAGRIVENKGVKHLLMALNLLPEEIPFKLLVIGSFGSGFGRGDKRDAFHDELMKLADLMPGKIIFTGFVHNSGLPKYHVLADVVVMPSLCEEAAGKVAMEAMASGRPVITTNAGGIPEYVTEECGIILKRGDHFVSDLAAAIRDLASDPAKRRRMGAAGAIEARNFAPEIYYSNYVKLAAGTAQAATDFPSLEEFHENIKH